MVFDVIIDCFPGNLYRNTFVEPCASKGVSTWTTFLTYSILGKQFVESIKQGGANRFGIVTRYEMSALHVGKNDDKNFIGGSITVSVSHMFIFDVWHP